MENSDAIEEEIRLCGYFCIVTSRKMTGMKQALELYKSRDESEKLFKSDKTYLETERSAFKRTRSRRCQDIYRNTINIRNKIYITV